MRVVEDGTRTFFWKYLLFLLWGGHCLIGSGSLFDLAKNQTITVVEMSGLD